VYQITLSASPEDQFLTISLGGQLDASAAKSLASLCDKAVTPDQLLLLYFSEVRTADESLLGALLHARDRAGGEDARILLFNTPTALRDLLERAECDNLFTFDQLTRA